MALGAQAPRAVFHSQSYLASIDMILRRNRLLPVVMALSNMRRVSLLRLPRAYFLMAARSSFLFSVLENKPKCITIITLPP